MVNILRRGLSTRASFVWTTAMVMLCSIDSGAQAPTMSTPPPAPFGEQIVFLYYADLTTADAFFTTALGLSKTMDQDWVKIYRTAGGSAVGAVKEGRGFHKPSPSKPVMISWVVDDIDPWYRRVTAAGVKVLKPPQDSAASGVRSFLVADPTGYTFEFMQWLKR